VKSFYQEYLTFRKEAFWAISNLSVGTQDQIEMILENDNSIERLKTAVATEKLDVKKLQLLSHNFSDRQKSCLGNL